MCLVPFRNHSATVWIQFIPKSSCVGRLVPRVKVWEMTNVEKSACTQLAGTITGSESCQAGCMPGSETVGTPCHAVLTTGKRKSWTWVRTRLDRVVAPVSIHGGQIWELVRES